METKRLIGPLVGLTLYAIDYALDTEKRLLLLAQRVSALEPVQAVYRGQLIQSRRYRAAMTGEKISDCLSLNLGLVVQRLLLLPK